MHWLSMNLGEKSFKLCIDEKGFAWFCEADVVINCKITHFDDIYESLKDLYCVEDWVYEKNPRKEFEFPDGSSLMCLYDDFVWWLSIRFGKHTLTEAIERFLYLGIDDFVESLETTKE